MRRITDETLAIAYIDLTASANEATPTIAGVPPHWPRIRAQVAEINEAIRALAGVPRACIGYPDGVPETWRTPARVMWAEPAPGDQDPAALLGPLRPDWSRHDAGGAGGGAVDPGDGEDEC